jgi:hypothetical protein
MENEVKQPVDYYETLVQNAQKGETFSIKFWNDPEIYTGIPFVRDLSKTAGNTNFMFKVLSPEKHKGVFEKSLGEIEILRREVY